MRLCPKCKKEKLVCMGITMHGDYGSEVIAYWCEKCEVLHLYKIKDFINHWKV